MLQKKSLAIVLIILLFVLMGCGSSPASTGSSSDTSKEAAPEELVIVDWGGAITDAHKKAIFDAFEKQYNAKITVVTPTDYGKFKAMVESNNVEWDVVNVDSDFVIRGGKEGLLEKLDYSVINKDGVLPQLVDDYGIGAELFSVVIGYNTDKFTADNHPKNWSEFWDTQKFPGPRSMWKYATGTLESALLADGVEPDKLYPLDVDRAFKSLEKIKKNVNVWWTTGAQPPQLLANQEVTLAAAWNGRVSAAKAQGAPEDVEFNQGIVMGDSWVVPKGAKHKDLAMKFIAFAVDPKQQAEFSSNIDYAPANTKALDLLSDDVKKRLGQSEENIKNQVIVDIRWWVDNYDKVNERFQTFLLGN